MPNYFVDQADLEFWRQSLKTGQWFRANNSLGNVFCYPCMNLIEFPKSKRVIFVKLLNHILAVKT
jgi:hypothetical protein